MLNRLNLRNLVPFYALAWILFSAISFIVVNAQPGAVFRLVLAESLIFNLVFALLGIGLWFLVKFSDFEKLRPRELISRHITISALTLFLWFGSSYLLMGLVSGHDPAYMDRLNHSMYLRLFAGLLTYIIIVTVFYLIINYRNLAERRHREASLQQLLHESELNSLKAQIKPHFLFNALNSISSLTVTNPQKAQEMVINLSDFMRYSLSFAGDGFSTLKKELDHVRLYLEIEKVRFGERLSVEEHIDPETGDWPVPPMILQPLVENSVKHGIYDTPGKSLIKLKAKISGTRLQISILNNYDPTAATKAGTGTGLSNVIKRCSMIYGITDLVQVTANENLFEVKLSLPPNGKIQSTDHR